MALRPALAFAVEAGADLVWLMDDDTVPSADGSREPGAAHMSDYPDAAPAAVASRVLWLDGRDHPMNTPRVRPGSSRRGTSRLPQRSDAYPCGRHRSSPCLSRVLRPSVRWGCPRRTSSSGTTTSSSAPELLRDRVGLYCPASRVEHRTTSFGSTDRDPGDRFYFEVRNKIWTFTRSAGLRPRRRRCTPDLPSDAGRAPLQRQRTARCCCGHFGEVSSTASVAAREPAAEVMSEAGVSIPTSWSVGIRPMTSLVPFSLLLPTYHADDPEHLKRAFDSAVDDQVAQAR